MPLSVFDCCGFGLAYHLLCDNGGSITPPPPPAAAATVAGFAQFLSLLPIFSSVLVQSSIKFKRTSLNFNSNINPSLAQRGTRLFGMGKKRSRWRRDEIFRFIFSRFSSEFYMGTGRRFLDRTIQFKVQTGPVQSSMTQPIVTLDMGQILGFDLNNQ